VATFQAHDVIVEVDGRRVATGSTLAGFEVESSRVDSHGSLVITVSCTPTRQFFDRVRQFAGAVEDAGRAMGRYRLFFGLQPAISEDVHKRHDAELRAQELLCQHLTPQQCEDRGEFGYFWVESFGRKFCIGCAMDFIEEHDAAGKLASYCLQTAEWGLPREDKILAVLLMLKYTPDKFFSEANILWHREDRWVTLLDNQGLPPLEVWRPQSTYREWYDRHYHQKG